MKTHWVKDYFLINRMKKLFFILPFLIVLISCENQGYDYSVPSDILPKDVFTEILTETTLLEGYLSNTNVNIPHLRDESLGKYKFILEKHEITYDEYKKSYFYYVAQPYFIEMAQESLDSIINLERQLDELPQIQQISFADLKNLLIDDGWGKYMKFHRGIAARTMIDSIGKYYSKNVALLDKRDIDSTNFQYSLGKFKTHKPLYQTLRANIINGTKFEE